MELSLRIKVEPFQNDVKLQAAVSMMASKNPPPLGHMGAGMWAEGETEGQETGLTTGFLVMSFQVQFHSGSDK